MTAVQADCYRIVIPRWTPARLNQMMGRHWSVIQKLKRTDLNLLAFYGRDIPLAGGPRSVKLIITLGPRQRGADPDAFWKSILDALVTRGLLVDDSRKWCRIEPVEFVRGTEKSTTIELRDL